VVDGRTLRFHLAGINNQNFVMQDEETGTWWQQVSGDAILGPLKGKRLTLVPFDQLTFAMWRTEAPHGRVLTQDGRILEKGRYARRDWETRMQSTPVPSGADTTLLPRTLIIGVEAAGEARAYPLASVDASGVIIDELGADGAHAALPVAIVRAPDGRSTRVFNRSVDGRALDLVARIDRTPFRLVDTQTGTEWDFSGVAVEGPLRGRRLERVPFLEEYWFDWKTYHPRTTVSGRGLRAQG